MGKKWAVLIVVVLVGALQPASAQEPADRVSMALRKALAAMEGDGFLVMGSVRYPAVVRRLTVANFEVDRISVSGGKHLDARMHCRPSGVCLPFHVSAELEGTKTGAMRTWWVLSTKQAAVPVNRLKRGARVVFIREADGIRTQMNAMTLDSAAIGERLRVRALDGRHELLRGRLAEAGVVRSE